MEQSKEEVKVEKKEEVKVKKEPREIKPPMDVEPKSTGLSSQVRNLNEKLELLTGAKESKTKKKNFKLPMGMKGKLKKLAKLNQVQVMYLQHNRNIKPLTAEIIEGMVVVGDKVYDGSTDGIWLWNGKIPTLLIAEWDLKPISASRLHGEAVEDGSIAHPQKIIIRAIELKEALQGGKKLSSKAIIWIMIGVVIVGYVLFANQGQ